MSKTKPALAPHSEAVPAQTEVKKTKSLKIELSKPVRKAARAEARLEGLKLRAWVLKLITERLAPLAAPTKLPKRRTRQKSD